MDFISNIWNKTASAIVPEGAEPKDGENQKTSPTEKQAADAAPVEGGDGDAVTQGKADDKTTESPSKEGEEGGEAVTTQMLHNVENASHKAMEGAKSFGSFIFSVANKAGKTVTETATKIKTTVEENHAPVVSMVKQFAQNPTSILADFNREQDTFLASRSKSGCAALPWQGCENEAEIKTQIISLSEDKRTFVRNPPNGVQFDFDMDQAAPVAITMLKEDPRLEQMRFELVPKLINEHDFWRNYFYRVSLVKQSNQLNSLAKSGGESGNGSTDTSTASGPQTPSDDGKDDETGADGATSDFVSDSYEGKVSAEEVEKGMAQLGCLEKELEKELDGYEVVPSEAAGGIADDEDLENEIQNLLTATRK